jgi:hypothetical protein
VDAGAMQGYVEELGRVLADDGVAFLHHSNAAALGASYRASRRVPARLLRQLARASVLPDVNKARDGSVSGDAVAGWAEGAGLRAITQERISWGTGRWLTDCLTVIARPGSRWDQAPARWRNTSFAREARAVARLTRYP